MKKIFFTADTHFFHKNVIRLCNRPFANVDEMNEKLIENWNRKVDVLDDIYHLGDFFWTDKKEDIESIIYRLNGNIYLIKGNHDSRKQLKILSDCKNVRWIDNYFELKLNDKLFVLFHYPMRTWNKSIHESFHLYGHVHGNTETSRIRNSMDVGVDANNFEPISLEEVIEKLK